MAEFDINGFYDVAMEAVKEGGEVNHLHFKCHHVPNGLNMRILTTSVDHQESFPRKEIDND